jgi:hypothetical protein
MSDIFSEFNEALARGDLDNSIPEILVAIEERQGILREQVLKLVRRIYGEGAEITTAPSQVTHALARSAPLKSDNPFIQKAQEEGPQDPPGLPSTTSDPFPDDPLEAEMQPVPFEMRGAIISGFHPSQMGGS